jgi:hypothetical protein
MSSFIDTRGHCARLHPNPPDVEASEMHMQLYAVGARRCNDETRNDFGSLRTAGLDAALVPLDASLPIL